MENYSLIAFFQVAMKVFQLVMPLLLGFALIGLYHAITSFIKWFKEVVSGFAKWCKKAVKHYIKRYKIGELLEDVTSDPLSLNLLAEIKPSKIIDMKLHSPFEREVLLYSNPRTIFGIYISLGIIDIFGAAVIINPVVHVIYKALQGVIFVLSIIPYEYIFISAILIFMTLTHIWLRNKEKYGPIYIRITKSIRAKALVIANKIAKLLLNNSLAISFFIFLIIFVRALELNPDTSVDDISPILWIIVITMLTIMKSKGKTEKDTKIILGHIIDMSIMYITLPASITFITSLYILSSIKIFNIGEKVKSNFSKLMQVYLLGCFVTLNDLFLFGIFLLIIAKLVEEYFSINNHYAIRKFELIFLPIVFLITFAIYLFTTKEYKILLIVISFIMGVFYFSYNNHRESKAKQYAIYIKAK